MILYYSFFAYGEIRNTQATSLSEARKRLGISQNARLMEVRGPDCENIMTAKQHATTYTHNY